MSSVSWNGNSGAVCWGNGKIGTSGIVSNLNSFTGVTDIYNPGSAPLLGTTLPAFSTDARIDLSFRNYGYNNIFYETIGTENLYLKNLSDNYIVQGINTATGKATVTWGNGADGTIGTATTCNTVYGLSVNNINTMNYVFDSIYNYLLVSRSAENIVSRYYPALGATTPANNDASTSSVSGSDPVIFPTTTGCGQIASLTPSGTNPVSGSVTATTWLEPTQPVDFVARHYEITPATNASTSTGTITLYFTQIDFDNFNNQNPAPTSALPTGPHDSAGIANLLVEKISGTTNVGTGLPNTYPGPTTIIDPADNNIVWNATLDRWEVTFSVTSFSGFFIIAKTAASLPLQLINFSGKRQNNSNLLQWKTTNEINTKNFEIESSANGSSFAYISNVAATGSGSYSFTDNYPLANRTYYRLKMTDIDGKFTYSNIIWIDGTGNTSISLYPNPVTKMTTLNIGNNNSLIGTQAQLTNADGKLLQIFYINNNQEQLNMADFAAGLYFLKLKDGSIMKIVKQ